MRCHPVELDVWFLVGLFVYSHTLCVQTAKVLAWAFVGRLCDKYHNLMSWLILSQLQTESDSQNFTFMLFSIWQTFQEFLHESQREYNFEAIKSNIAFILTEAVPFKNMWNWFSVRCKNSWTVVNKLISDFYLTILRTIIKLSLAVKLVVIMGLYNLIPTTKFLY